MIKSFHCKPAVETETGPVDQSPRRRTIILFLAVVAIVGWIYFFFFSDIFVIKAIEITDTQRLKRGEVERIAFDALDKSRMWPIRARNIFSINKDETEKQLKNELYVENVTVDKKYPDILRLKVQERQSTIIVISGGNTFEIDRHGIITREIADAELQGSLKASVGSDHSPSRIPVLSFTTSSGTPMVDDQFASESQVTRWLDTFDTLRKRGFGYRNALMEKQDSTKLMINMHETYDVYFDLLTSIDAQIDGYFAFIKSKTEDMVIHEYVDARIPGKIYYR